MNITVETLQKFQENVKISLKHTAPSRYGFSILEEYSIINTTKHYHQGGGKVTFSLAFIFKSAAADLQEYIEEELVWSVSLFNFSINKTIHVSLELGDPEEESSINNIPIIVGTVISGIMIIVTVAVIILVSLCCYHQKFKVKAQCRQQT